MKSRARPPCWGVGYGVFLLRYLTQDKGRYLDRFPPVRYASSTPFTHSPMHTQLVRKNDPSVLPPILLGSHTPAAAERVRRFYSSLASLFESWVTRRKSPHTQRAYREDIMTFVRFLGLAWPGEADELLRVSIVDVQRFRDSLLSQNAAPKTLNRRISSVSSFYKYVGAPRSSAASTLPTPFERRRPRSCSTPTWTSSRSRTCWATATSPPPRSTTSAGGRLPRAQAICWRFDGPSDAYVIRYLAMSAQPQTAKSRVDEK